MIKRLTLTVMLLISGFIITTAQGTAETFPSDVVTQVQAEMDSLTAETFPPGMVHSELGVSQRCSPRQ